MIKIRGVEKTFPGPAGPVKALQPIDLEIPAGAFISLIGPSGCGKSTLLRILAGLEEPSSGHVEVAASTNGEPRAGFVFQEPVLLPWLSSRENVRFPLDTAGMSRQEANQRADELLAMMGLSSFADALPRTLSGGMRQRVAIARSLSYDPSLLLMDEPFGALDLLTRDRLNDELLALWTRTRKTIVLVTHSVEEAAYLSDTVVVMSSQPGSVKQVYAVPFERPRGEATKLDPRFHAMMAQLRRDLA